MTRQARGRLGGRPGPARRSSAASPPGPTTVLRNSWWSYWRKTQVGSPSRAHSASATSAAGTVAPVIGGSAAPIRRGCRQRPVVEGGVVGERGRRHVGQHRAVESVEDAQAPDRRPVGPDDRLGDRPDPGGPDLPALADLGHPGPRRRGDDGQHPLLALAGHHLPGLHPLGPPGHGGHVDVHPDAAPGRGLAGGAGEPGTTKILDPHHQSLRRAARGRPRSAASPQRGRLPGRSVAWRRRPSPGRPRSRPRRAR